MNLPEAAFAQFPKKQLYIGPGKVPPPVEEFRNKDLQWFQSTHKYRLDLQAPKTFEGGRDRVREGVPDSDHDDRREDGDSARRLREMHWHPHADEWQYYLKGRSRIRSLAHMGAGRKTRSALANSLSSNKAMGTTSSSSATSPPKS